MRFLGLLVCIGAVVGEDLCTKWRVKPEWPNVPESWCDVNCYAPGTTLLHSACDAASGEHQICVCEGRGTATSNQPNDELYAEVGEWLDVFAGKTCDFAFTGPCTCQTLIHGAEVHIEEGFEPGDELRCPACAGLGITATYDSSKGMLDMVGSQSLADYVSALSSVQLQAINEARKKLIINYGHAAFSTRNNHFYKFFNGQHTWVEAQRLCASPNNDLLGLVGYLVTITSAEEQGIVESKLQGSGWMGASDNHVEGTWRWVTGPEGCAPYDTSSAVAFKRSACDMEPIVFTYDGCNGPQCGMGDLLSTTYVNWKNGEPNDYRRPCPGLCETAGEDYAHFYYNSNTGKWNDYPVQHRISGYVCEWGGVGQLCIPPTEVGREIEILPNPCDPRASILHIQPSGSRNVPGVAVVEGMEGWAYGVQGHTTQLHAFPRILHGGLAHVIPSQPLGEKSKFEITCKMGCQGDACEVFISIHNCNANGCHAQNGKLPGQLALYGWEASSCSPVFSVDGGNERYKMLTFRKVLLPGEKVTTPESIGELGHVVLFSVPSKECGSLGEIACNDATTCIWRNGQCEYAWCPRSRGPFNSAGTDPARCTCPPN